jgi:UDP-N-acetylmuramoyl-tripeptide--D-alanyl-D-alanine ligase
MKITELYKIYKKSQGVSTDTRSLKKGELFFALKGGNFNGNTHAQTALEKGASYVVIDEESYKKSDAYILVEDVLATLQNLAKYRRQQFDKPVIGLTGSNGKTTTKELIRVVLEQKYKVHATLGNLNNHIGVPLTLLAMPDDAEIAIIEMGANHVGEIAVLSEICQPTVGLITNIGHAHTEGFGGFEGVIRGKSELYHYLIQNKREVIINSKDVILSNMARRFKNPYFYGNQGDYFNAAFLEASPFIHYRESNETIHTNLIGKYNFDNISAALCLGKMFEVPSQKSNQAIADYVPKNNRSQVVKTEKGNTVIMDAYNANFSSMSAALESFGVMKGTNKVVILGDMLELGEQSSERHQEIINKAKQLDLTKLILCGKEFGKVNQNDKTILYFQNSESISDWLKKELLNNTTILLKGSRGIALEKVLVFL